MSKRVLIIGGYGNFGSYIAKSLAVEQDIQLIIAGRHIEKARRLSQQIKAVNSPESAQIDINKGFETALSSINPDIVIHTSGPFQSQCYNVANACITQGCHYIDLADGREFVESITQLDNAAMNKGVLIISGASSVPCLTSALVDQYQHEFGVLEHLYYGISTAQKTNRGLATTQAILSYTGKPFKTLISGKLQTIFGWQNLRSRYFPNLGNRLLGNCDIPDLSLFPKRYPTLKTIRFYAGLEISFIHVTLWLLSWAVRLKLISKLEKSASFLLETSYFFDKLGSDNSAFFMELIGTDKEGKNKTLLFDLTAKSGDGPYIPCMPAILMALKLAKGNITTFGAYPCVGFITSKEYLDALKPLNIAWRTHQPH